MATGSAQPFMRASDPAAAPGTGTAGDVIGTSTQQRTTHLGAPSVRKALGTDCAIQLNLTLNGSAGALNVTVLDKVDDGINGHGRIGVICRTLGHHALGAGGALPADLPHTGIPSSVWHVTLVW